MHIAADRLRPVELLPAGKTPTFTRMHVTAYLNAPAKHDAGPIAVILGKDG